MAGGSNIREWLALVVAIIAATALGWGLVTGAMPSRRWRVRRADKPRVFWSVAGGLAALAGVAGWIFIRAFAWKVGNSV